MRTKEGIDAMTFIASDLTKMIEKYTHHHRTDISVTYESYIAEEIEERFRQHCIRPHEEYFMIWKDEGDERLLLYAVNVSGDANLTAIWEAMDLISRKFC